MQPFDETQRPTQRWLWPIWGLILGLAAFLWVAVVRQVFLGHPVGARPAQDAVLLALWVGAGILLPGLLFALRMRTRIDSAGIHIRFHPIHRRWRSWLIDEVQEVAPRRYSALGEYGGWGIRFGLRGVAYTVAGAEGVELTLASGRRVLIGTRDPEGFLEAWAEARRAGRCGGGPSVPGAGDPF